MRTQLHIQSYSLRIAAVCSSMLFLALILSPALSAQSPPKNLKLVGDHWTAWDPPPVVEEGADVYIIQSGDTLWDLAEQFYSDPYLWPQIWERNQYILDAHWIYPGDPLVMGMQIEGAEDVLGQPGQQASAGMVPEKERMALRPRCSVARARSCSSELRMTSTAVASLEI